MVEQTPRLDLDTYSEGESWDHTDTVEALDESAIVHGPIADRPTTGEYDDELYHATDQNITWRWDSSASDWEYFSGQGSSGTPVPGTSHFEAATIDGVSSPYATATDVAEKADDPHGNSAHSVNYSEEGHDHTGEAITPDSVGTDVVDSGQYQVGNSSALISIAATGEATLSSGTVTVDTGLSDADATFYLALGVDDPGADVGLAGRLFWDDSAGTYQVTIEEIETEVGNPTANYDILRVR